MKTKIETGIAFYDDFYPTVKNFLEKDQVTYTIDGERVHGYRSPDCNAIWIRDHSDIIRGARYLESDMISAATHFAMTQRANGSLFDFVSCAMDRENWTKYVRVPVEADVEFRFVKALFLGWQTTGNDVWLKQMLPHAERALNYTMSHPWRWSDEHGLVKRALSVDTWDFDYVSPNQPWLNFQITDDTHWGIFHGDNSGLFEVCMILSQLFDSLNDKNKSDFWKEKALDIQTRANKICWNGDFYTHRIPLDGFTVSGVDESKQISLSNPMAINRKMATHEMAVKILQEYQRRKKSTGSFAEWFSIDPAFPDGIFGDEKIIKGAYCNGGVMPLVGGEIARAAFEHGFEKYGLATLSQYAKMIYETGETYLWYFHDGTASSIETSTSPDATPTDGWGSSAMLYAFMEGLVGVTDNGCKFNEITLSPRWVLTEVTNAKASINYPASDTTFEYEYTWNSSEKKIDLHVQGTSNINLHLLLPDSGNAREVKLDGKVIDFKNTTVESSHYVDSNIALNGNKKIEILYE